MSHPFEALLEKQIANSHGDENRVLGEAERLMNEGYPPNEIYSILLHLRQSLVSATDEGILDEAIEGFSFYIRE